MRYMIPAFAALVLAASPMAAFAQAAVSAPAAAVPAPAVTSPAQAAPIPATPGKTTLPDTPAPKPRLTRLERRFNAANTTHDGHLTLQQARTAKWKQVVTRFSTIDADKKGYVTEDEVRNAAAMHAAMHAAKAKPSAATPSKG